MFFPQEVRETHNGYHATYAAVRCALDSGCVSHLVIPGMCTGIGKMLFDQAAQQMIDGITDALGGKPPRYTEEQIRLEQPMSYANKEYFDTYGIDISKKI
jgi:O-acetyl-ADP-ribose deacetylase (regulator of RNase III)